MQNQINKKLFIVDDDPFWTGILLNMLTSIGCTDIETFNNGKDCINNMHLNPGTIFLDYQMEGLDGIEVLNQLKRHDSTTNVIFATAFEDLEIAMTALQNGSKDYILKTNVTISDLHRIVQNNCATQSNLNVQY